MALIAYTHHVCNISHVAAQSALREIASIQKFNAMHLQTHTKIRTIDFLSQTNEQIVIDHLILPIASHLIALVLALTRAMAFKFAQKMQSKFLLFGQLFAMLQVQHRRKAISVFIYSS